MMNPKCQFETREGPRCCYKCRNKLKVARPQYRCGNTIRNKFLDTLGPSPFLQVENTTGRLNRHLEQLNMVRISTPINRVKKNVRMPFLILAFRISSDNRDRLIGNLE